MRERKRGKIYIIQMPKANDIKVFEVAKKSIFELLKTDEHQTNQIV